jgi:PKHD-type hydroxylase
MIFQFPDILKPEQVDAMREALGAPHTFSDGAATAAGRARSVKNNEQATGGAAKGVIEMARDAILTSPLVTAAAQPSGIARIMANRYGEGMEYGAHVDAPYIDGQRTDISFTLFLSDPATYDGGELVIEGAASEDRIKLPAGALVLYPSTSVHRVERVRRGERLAIVGWIKSRVRSAEARLLIYEAERIAADLAALGAPADLRDRSANLKNNLMRFFGD